MHSPQKGTFPEGIETIELTGSAAEGHIPWKGLKPFGPAIVVAPRRRRAHSLEGIETVGLSWRSQHGPAAEGHIPWKGLKQCRELGLVHLQVVAAEGHIPWKGLKRANARLPLGAARAAEGQHSLEGIETSRIALPCNARIAAEGHIPWKGLKPQLRGSAVATVRRRRAHSLEGIETVCSRFHLAVRCAAEGHIPWKGLKHLPGLPMHIGLHVAAEGHIPWKGLKQTLSNARFDVSGRRRAHSLEGIETRCDACDTSAPMGRRRAHSLEGIETPALNRSQQRIGAAEGHIPWKGLKLQTMQRGDRQIVAAEGHIPWKGLKR